MLCFSKSSVRASVSSVSSVVKTTYRTKQGPPCCSVGFLCQFVRDRLCTHHRVLAKGAWRDAFALPKQSREIIRILEPGFRRDLFDGLAAERQQILGALQAHAQHVFFQRIASLRAELAAQG